MKIAVIGAGVSGLVVARKLHARHDVTVFEAGDAPGGHARTIDVACGGQTYAVDTGFVVFNDRTYPEFLRILDDLRVPTQPSEMSFSVRCDRTGIEYSGASLNAVFAQRRNLLRPTFLRLVRDYLRFNRQAPKLLEADEGLTLDDYLVRRGVLSGLSRALSGAHGFRHMVNRPRALRPDSGSVVGPFFSQPWAARDHGQAALVGDRRRRPRIRRGAGAAIPRSDPYRATVTRVRRAPDHVDVTVAGGGAARFDQVVFATHSDQALRTLEDPTTEERAVLGAIEYQTNSVVLHTDTSLLPRRRRAWAAWNYYIAPDGGDRVAMTYNMNRLQRLDAPETFCVTLNQDERIDDAAVIARMTYHHPTLNRAAITAQRRWTEVNGCRRTWYAGAYWRYGFHEDGVVSGLRVARAIEAGA